MCSAPDYENEESLLEILRTYTDYLEEEPYHTPKNIFNPEVIRLSQLSQSQLGSSLIVHRIDEMEENPYSTIKKYPTSQAEKMMKLPMEQTTYSTNLSQVSVKSCLLHLSNCPEVKKKTWKKRLSEIDTCDYVLTAALIITTILFLFGITLLCTE